MQSSHLENKNKVALLTFHGLSLRFSGERKLKRRFWPAFSLRQNATRMQH